MGSVLRRGSNSRIVREMVAGFVRFRFSETSRAADAERRPRLRTRSLNGVDVRQRTASSNCGEMRIGLITNKRAGRKGRRR